MRKVKKSSKKLKRKNGMQGKIHPRRGGMNLPPSEVAKIQKLWKEGNSLLKISREVDHAWISCQKAVDRIVEDVDRERYHKEREEGSLEASYNRVEGVVGNQKSGNLGILIAARIVGNHMRRPARVGIIVPPSQGAIHEKTFDERTQEMAKGFFSSFAEMAYETHKLFELDMPEMDAVKEQVKGKKEVTIDV
jgi:hypothetical protein